MTPLFSKIRPFMLSCTTMASADFSDIIPPCRHFGSRFLRQCLRSPRVRRTLFFRYAPNLLPPLTCDYRASPSLAGLPSGDSLISGFCSSRPKFRHQLPSDSISRWTPLHRRTVPVTSACGGLSPLEGTPCLAH